MEWISINDKIPNHNEMVLVYAYDDIYICTFEVFAGLDRFTIKSSNDYFYKEEIACWMPIPTPQKID